VAVYALVLRKKGAIYVGVAAELAALAWVGYELCVSHLGLSPRALTARSIPPYVAMLAVVAIGLSLLPGMKNLL